MKLLFAAVGLAAAMTALGAQPAAADRDHRRHDGWGRPVIVAPAPVYVVPPPAYYYAPRPVYVAPPPVVYAPPPPSSFNLVVPLRFN